MCMISLCKLFCTSQPCCDNGLPMRGNRGRDYSSLCKLVSNSNFFPLHGPWRPYSSNFSLGHKFSTIYSSFFIYSPILFYYLLFFHGFPNVIVHTPTNKPWWESRFPSRESYNGGMKKRRKGKKRRRRDQELWIYTRKPESTEVSLMWIERRNI